MASRNDGSILGCMPLDQASASAYQHLTPWSVDSSSRPSKAAKASVGDKQMVVLHLEIVSNAESGSGSASGTANIDSSLGYSPPRIIARPWCDRDSLEAWINQVKGPQRKNLLSRSILTLFHLTCFRDLTCLPGLQAKHH